MLQAITIIFTPCMIIEKPIRKPSEIIVNTGCIIENTPAKTESTPQMIPITPIAVDSFNPLIAEMMLLTP